MKVISLFDGISCGRVALERANIEVEKYIAFEVDEKAIQVSKFNYSDIEHKGNVFDANFKDYLGYDLLIGGSPCTYWSIANKERVTTNVGLGWELFEQYKRALIESECKYFLYENNKSITKEIQKVISKELGVQPICINSGLVSGQNRQRLYWTNIPNVEEPKDLNISLQDILDKDDHYLKKFKANKTASRERMWNKGKGKNGQGSCANITNASKSYTITTKQDRCPNAGLIEYEDFCRYLTIHEQERLQTLPTGYTDCLKSKTAQEKAIGNGWTVDVIVHILKHIKES